MAQKQKRLIIRIESGYQREKGKIKGLDLRMVYWSDRNHERWDPTEGPRDPWSTQRLQPPRKSMDPTRARSTILRFSGGVRIAAIIGCRRRRRVVFGTPCARVASSPIRRLEAVTACPRIRLRLTSHGSGTCDGLRRYGAAVPSVPIVTFDRGEPDGVHLKTRLVVGGALTVGALRDLLPFDADPRFP
jgi:hypothetical protein